jgi:hypothetical protein
LPGCYDNYVKMFTNVVFMIQVINIIIELFLHKTKFFYVMKYWLIIIIIIIIIAVPPGGGGK